MAKAMAFLISSLSNGGAPGLTIRLIVLLEGTKLAHGRRRLGVDVLEAGNRDVRHKRQVDVA
jgi:hypothetical protein